MLVPQAEFRTATRKTTEYVSIDVVRPVNSVHLVSKSCKWTVLPVMFTEEVRQDVGDGESNCFVCWTDRHGSPYTLNAA